ncbi:hypothetical protein GCM10027514_23140 [Azotobacter armeniacus]
MIGRALLDRTQGPPAGPTLEKSIAPLRSFVVEPMQYDRCQGPESGRRRRQSPVPHLGQGLMKARTDLLEKYSPICLRRIWKAECFSWWMTTLLHEFPGQGGFDTHLQET